MDKLIADPKLTKCFAVKENNRDNIYKYCVFTGKQDTIYSTSHKSIIEWEYDNSIIEMTTVTNTACKIKAKNYGKSKLYYTVYVRRGATVDQYRFGTTVTVSSPDGTPYKIVFKPNYKGSSDKDVVIDSKAGAGYKLPDAETIGFTRDGFEIVGWSEKSDTEYDDVNNYYSIDSLINVVKGINEVKTFYAVWAPKDNGILRDFWCFSEYGDDWIEVYKGETKQIEFAYDPGDVKPDKTFKFISEDDRIATVDDEGRVTGVTYGYTFVHILYNPSYDEEDGKWHGTIEREIEVDVFSPSYLENWVRENGHWRYYENGKPVTNEWRSNEYGRKYLDDSGNMETNSFVEYDGYLYYVDNVGNRVRKKWLEKDDKRYYFDQNGIAYTEGIYKIDGQSYQFNESGVLLDEDKLTATVKNNNSDGVVSWKADSSDSSTDYFIYRKNIPVGRTEDDAVIEKAAEVTGVTKWTDGSFSNKKGSVQYLVKYTDEMPEAEEFSGPNATERLNVLFTDVTKSSDYYFNPVYWAAENGITNGYTSGTNKGKFGVNMNCQRRELLIFLWRYAGCPTGYEDARTMFNDLGSYAASSATNQAIAWACTEGITKGYSDGGFHPTAPIVRKDVMILLYRLAGKPAVSGALSFPDCKRFNKSSDTYKAILWGSQKGITKGYNSGQYKGQFGVNLNCLREQIVTFLYRYDTN